MSIRSFNSDSFLSNIPVLSAWKAGEKTLVLLLLFLHFHQDIHELPEILVCTLATLQCVGIQMIGVRGAQCTISQI